jgi:hypothetical protein
MVPLGGQVKLAIYGQGQGSPCTVGDWDYFRRSNSSPRSRRLHGAEKSAVSYTAQLKSTALNGARHLHNAYHQTVHSVPCRADVIEEVLSIWTDAASRKAMLAVASVVGLGDSTMCLIAYICGPLN